MFYMQLCFKKLFCPEIKLAKVVKILAALVAALSILNSSGASPGATENVAALVTALLIVLSIYIIIESDASWYNTLDDTLSSLNTLLYWYSSRNSRHQITVQLGAQSFDMCCCWLKYY